MSYYVEVLTAAGFEPDDEHTTAVQEQAHSNGAAENGGYKVLHGWSKGEVRVHLEQNTAPEDLGGGATAVVTYPPVLVVEGPNGRVSVSPDQPEALQDVLEAVA